MPFAPLGRRPTGGSANRSVSHTGGVAGDPIRRSRTDRLAEAVGGELGLSEETTEVGYFSLREIESMDMWEHHVVRINDAFVGTERAFVR